MPPRVGRIRGIAATPATRWRGAQVTRPKLGRPEQWPSNAETSGVTAVMRKALSPALDDAPVELAVDRGLRQQDRHIAVYYREALGLGAAGAGDIDQRRTAHDGVDWVAAEAERDGVRGLDLGAREPVPAPLGARVGVDSPHRSRRAWGAGDHARGRRAAVVSRRHGLHPNRRAVNGAEQAARTARAAGASSRRGTALSADPDVKPKRTAVMVEVIAPPFSRFLHVPWLALMSRISRDPSYGDEGNARATDR